MRDVNALWRYPLISLGWVLSASVLGWGVNAARRASLPLVAPFSYAHDCPEKFVLSSPQVAAKLALRLAQKQPGEVLFVDARPTELFSADHPPGARSIPYSFITPFGAGAAAPLRAYKHIFLYCDSPKDRLAGLQAELMRKAGLSQVRTIKGGLAALRGASPSTRPTRGAHE
ncbi:MAG: hypothetical protein JRH20_19040 [Deltaproteobacteria bacterium]|nr:hypothetical protein [Deltaproteobacteria bacterium]